MESLWVIDGKAYDMMPFVDQHPGGKHFLMVGRGRDCTELFKSVHVLSDAKFDAILAKYQVKHVQAQPSMFDFSEKSKFWWDLKNEVNRYFKEQIKHHHKGNVLFWIMTVVMFASIAYLCTKWVQTANVLLGFICGILVILSGFFVMHSASHGALAFSPSVNYGFTIVWCHYVWWHAWIWMQHHVYGHHSYTGLPGKDPDTRNMAPFARKHPEQKFQPFSKYQSWLPVLVQTVFPNQFIGQAWVYITSLPRQKLFGLPLTPEISSSDQLFYLFNALSVLLVFVIPLAMHGVSFLPSLLAYWSALGIGYWAIVFPNHDTIGVRNQLDESHEANLKQEESSWRSKDWAISQLLNSSNFWLPEFIAYISGGMNYQIEHHLFPTVHPLHYPALSKIVQRVAKKYQVPYLRYPSWFHSLMAHLKLLKAMSPNGSKAYLAKAA
jgi:fatty acid desaturase